MSVQLPTIDTNVDVNYPDFNQKPLIAQITEQEEKIRFNKFSYETAWEIGSKIRSLFMERRGIDVGQGKVGLVVHIELFNGHRLFTTALGAASGPANW